MREGQRDRDRRAASGFAVERDHAASFADAAAQAGKFAVRRERRSPYTVVGEGDQQLVGLTFQARLGGGCLAVHGRVDQDLCDGLRCQRQQPRAPGIGLAIPADQ